MLRIVHEDDSEQKAIIAEISDMLSDLSIQRLEGIKEVVEAYIMGSEDEFDEGTPTLRVLKGGKKS